MASSSGNNQIPYQYSVSFQVVINSQPVDLSTYVGAVILSHSISEIQPLFTISINSQILQSLNSGYQYAILTVNSYLENGSLLNTVTYNLIPYTLVSKTYQSNASQNSFFDASMTAINFISQSCYTVLNTPVPDTYLFNTTIQNILNNIKPKYCNYILDSNLDTSSIPQIHIPQQSFHGALEYIKYWNGYYPGTTIITTYPETTPEDTDNASVLITDIHKNIVSGNVDFNVVEILAGEPDTNDIQKQYIGNSNTPTIVCNNTISYISNVPRDITVSNFNVVTKPIDDLYNSQTLNAIDLINDYGVVQGTIDTTLENASELINNSIQNIYGHTGSVTMNWFTSNITYDMSNTNITSIIVNQKIIFGSIWAGYMFNLVISDINAQKHSGVYLVDSISFQLVNRSISWDMGVHITGMRSNFFNNQTV